MSPQRLATSGAYFKRTQLNFLIAFESILLVILMVTAIKVRDVGIVFQSDYKSQILLFAFPIIWLFALAVLGAWNNDIFLSRTIAYQRLINASVITFLMFSSASYIFKISISRFVILISLVGGTIALLVLRWIFFRVIFYRVKNQAQSVWLILGEDSEKEIILEKLASENNSHSQHAHLHKSGSSFEVWLQQILESTKARNLENIYILDSNHFTTDQLQAIIWNFETLGASVYLPDKLGIAASRSTNVFIGNEAWVRLQTPSVNDSMRVVKRIFDVFVAALALIILLPFFLLIELIIKITSKGPTFYIQKRIGREGILFNFPKFRTMYPGSEEDRLAVLGRPDESMADRYKSDPRITPFGRFLRRFSIDETPQFICVLLGSMSLVGPRPVLPEEEPQMGKIDFRRHVVKPGLTGIWQTSGRKETSWEERMAMDIEYVQKWKFTLDLVLIGHTVRAIISGEGSY